MLLSFQKNVQLSCSACHPCKSWLEFKMVYSYRYFFQVGETALLTKVMLCVDCEILSFKQNIEGPTNLFFCWLSWDSLLNARKGLILFHLIYSIFFKKRFCRGLFILLSQPVFTCSKLTIKTSGDIWCLYCWLWTNFTPCSSVSILSFEHVIVSWYRTNSKSAASLQKTNGECSSWYLSPYKWMIVILPFQI